MMNPKATRSTWSLVLWNYFEQWTSLYKGHCHMHLAMHLIWNLVSKRWWLDLIHAYINYAGTIARTDSSQWWDSLLKNSLWNQIVYEWFVLCIYETVYLLSYVLINFVKPSSYFGWQLVCVGWAIAVGAACSHSDSNWYL